MKQVEFWTWMVDSETPPGKRQQTRFKMSAEQAAGYGNPFPVPGTMELRQVAETEEEKRAAMFGNAPGTKTHRER